MDGLPPPRRAPRRPASLLAALVAVAAVTVTFVASAPGAHASEPPLPVEGRLFLDGVPGVGVSANLTLYVDVVRPSDYSETTPIVDVVAPDWVLVEGDPWQPVEGENHTWRLTLLREGAWRASVEPFVAFEAGLSSAFGFDFAGFRDAAVVWQPSEKWSFPDAAIEHAYAAQRTADGFEFRHRVEGVHDWMRFGSVAIHHAYKQDHGASEPGEDPVAWSTRTVRVVEGNDPWFQVDADWVLTFEHPTNPDVVQEKDLDCRVVFLEPRGDVLWLRADAPCGEWSPDWNETHEPRPLLPMWTSTPDPDAEAPAPSLGVASVALVAVGLLRARAR